MAIAAQGDVEIVAQEMGQGDVPAAPEFNNALGPVGAEEVSRQTDPDHEGERRRHVRIAGEVEIDLRRIGQHAQPGFGG